MFIKRYNTTNLAKTNSRQYEVIVEFMNKHPCIAKNGALGSAQGKVQSAQLRDNLTKQLSVADHP